MLYITQEARTPAVNAVVGHFVDAANNCYVGELNYILSSIVYEWMMEHGLSYNSAIGVLECMKLELYRQVAAPYEDRKKKENGPVSELDMDRS